MMAQSRISEANVVVSDVVSASEPLVLTSKLADASTGTDSGGVLGGNNDGACGEAEG